MKVEGILCESFIDPEKGLWWRTSGLESKYSRFNQLHDAVYRNGSWYIYDRGICFHWPRIRRGFARAGNFPSFDSPVPRTQITFLLLTIAYGGLHALAWNSHFPADTQQLLWRVSSVMIMGGGVILFILHWIKEDVYYRPPGYQWDSLDLLDTPSVVRWVKYAYQVGLALRILDVKLLIERGSPSTMTVELAIAGLKWLTILAYSLARVYIVVDCFIQVFHLAPGSFFQQPLWSVYFPHIG